MIEILSETALATVQDMGRPGALQWGVGTSGAMDRMSLAGGNLLLGNDEGLAAIEVPIFPFTLQFAAECVFALTGADCAALLNDRPLLPWWTHQAEAGQILHLGLPAHGPHAAARAYVCVAGGIDVPPALGSRSTQMRGGFGGFEGRALRKGDRLPVGLPGKTRANPNIGLLPPALAMPLERDGVSAVRVLPAAEYACYAPRSRSALWGERWKITTQSDRYGFRLAGPELELEAHLELRSHGIVPGVIQVPPGGQPIIQMRDAQPSGGYPKIGTVIEADLWRLGQAPLGSYIRFVEVTWAEALAAEQQNEAWLAQARRLLGLHHLQSGEG